jgi:hypothetical protein
VDCFSFGPSGADQEDVALGFGMLGVSFVIWGIGGWSMEWRMPTNLNVKRCSVAFELMVLNG